MNSEKPVSYEMISSDEESNQQQQQQGLEEAQDHDAAGTAAKRSYDCTYCKRGFTNAQALGGHMNIHRKDRTKAKQITIKPNQSSSSSSLHEEFMMMESHDQYQRNRDNYFHPPPPPTPNNNNFLIRNNNQPAPPPHAQHAYQFHPYEFNHNPIMSHHQPMNFNNQELHGANLSLQIGPSDDHYVGNPNYQVRRGAHKDSEVDLELRLGHDP